MVWLRNSKKFEDTPVCLLVSTEYANVTDRRTDGQNRMTAQAALMHNTSRQKNGQTAVRQCTERI